MCFLVFRIRTGSVVDSNTFVFGSGSIQDFGSFWIRTQGWVINIEKNVKNSLEENTPFNKYLKKGNYWKIIAPEEMYST